MLLGLRTAIYPVADIDSAKGLVYQAARDRAVLDQTFYVGFSVGGFELRLTPGGQSGAGGRSPSGA